MNARLRLLPVVAVNTVLSATSALGATLQYALSIRQTRASLCANAGWLASSLQALRSLATPLESIFAAWLQASLHHC